jgi:hypothetical protein
MEYERYEFPGYYYRVSSRSIKSDRVLRLSIYSTPLAIYILGGRFHRHRQKLFVESALQENIAEKPGSPRTLCCCYSTIP